MRVCIIGEFSGVLDEGMKNVMYHLTHQLSKYHDMRELSISPTQIKLDKIGNPILLVNYVKEIQKFEPSIIHYIPYSGLTPASLIRAKAIACCAPKARVVISCLQRSGVHFLPKKIISILKPDLVLVQSRETATILDSLGFKTRILLSGVDTSKFSPVSLSTKRWLRKKYGLGREFVILHVGHFNNQRGLEMLERLTDHDTKLVLVGSTSTPQDQSLIKHLLRNGAMVWTTYLRDIEDMYRLSDCYAFPVVNKSKCIESPLSILEAMACNLPVVSTRFCGLPESFEEGDGFFFVKDVEDIRDKITLLRNKLIHVKNRQKVLALSWERIATNLNDIYRDVVAEL